MWRSSPYHTRRAHAQAPEMRGSGNTTLCLGENEKVPDGAGQPLPRGLSQNPLTTSEPRLGNRGSAKPSRTLCTFLSCPQAPVPFEYYPHPQPLFSCRWAGCLAPCGTRGSAAYLERRAKRRAGRTSRAKAVDVGAHRHRTTLPHHTHAGFILPLGTGQPRPVYSRRTRALRCVTL